MPFVTRKSLLGLGLLGVVGVVVAGGFVWSGIYNIGADDTHTRPVYAVLQTLRERSISQRAKSLQVPDLSDPALIRQGAGNYNAMCTGCHLAPGMQDTELSKGLYPAPPAFAKVQETDPAHHFWVIKHGIKASGMPAWGKSMKDEYIWGMVAFLQQLPKLDETQYKTLVASSGGHSHGGGEAGQDHHDDGAADDHHEEGEGADHDMASMEMGKAAPAPAESGAAAAKGETHVHADGMKHVHAPKPTAKSPAATVPPQITTPAAKADTAEEATAEQQHDHHH